MKAFLQRRYNTLLNDLWGRKEILFIHKMFSLDFSELDKQENHDLRAQIQQNENWADWGLMMVQEVYESFMISVIGIFSGIALTITLFSSPVPNDSGWLHIHGQNIFFSQIPSTYPILYGQLNKTNQKPLSDGTNLLDRGIFVVILCNIVPAHSKVHNTCRFRLLPVRRVCLAGSQHPRGIQRFHRRICKRTDGERYR